eukprot:9366876-Lingulodinium_polyedra.AAC.1
MPTTSATKRGKAHAQGIVFHRPCWPTGVCTRSHGCFPPYWYVVHLERRSQSQMGSELQTSEVQS